MMWIILQIKEDVIPRGPNIIIQNNIYKTQLLTILPPRRHFLNTCLSLVGGKFQRLYYYVRNFYNLIGLEQWYFTLISGGVRHDPQRFMGKTVTMPHFNRDTVEFASRKRNESNSRMKTLLPFPKNITEQRDFENFQDLIVVLDACYWLHKTISRSLSRFGDERAI